jgi:hypothetical protein
LGSVKVVRGLQGGNHTGIGFNVSTARTLISSKLRQSPKAPLGSKQIHRTVASLTFANHGYPLPGGPGFEGAWPESRQPTPGQTWRLTSSRNSAGDIRSSMKPISRFTSDVVLGRTLPVTPTGSPCFKSPQLDRPISSRPSTERPSRPTPQQVVEGKDGKTGGRRALRAWPSWSAWTS